MIITNFYWIFLPKINDRNRNNLNDSLNIYLPMFLNIYHGRKITYWKVRNDLPFRELLSKRELLWRRSRKYDQKRESNGVKLQSRRALSEVERVTRTERWHVSSCIVQSPRRKRTSDRPLGRRMLRKIASRAEHTFAALLDRGWFRSLQIGC